MTCVLAARRTEVCGWKRKPYQRLGLQVHVHAVEGGLPRVGAVRDARRGDQDEVAEALEDVCYYATLAV
jgi:hypothetical protein